tara:strand:- start:35294 stop:37702 length:2409 start_codon:yes stop_codon:yes gene_type:complete
MPVFNNMLAGASGATGGDTFAIERSLRFNAPDSSHLSRTPSSAGNRKTWTWSGWIKKSGQSANQFFFGAGPDDGGNTNQIQFFFMPNDKFRITTAQVVFRETTQVFRDPSSFLHLVVAFDTTQSTANDRIKIYINGSQVTDFSQTNNPAQNADTGVNSAADHRIGQGSGASYSGSSYAFNGYLAECILVDGAALDPTSFGAFDDNGVWQGIDTAGLSFGTNGFRLKFADNSGATATTLGKDTSGNSNNWTPNNLSVTAGVGNDSLVDTPVNGTASSGGDPGGSIVGNYATWNPLSNSTNAPTNGNLDLPQTGGGVTRCNSTIAVSSGKWYFETTLVAAGSATTVGIAASEITDNYPGQDALSYAYTFEQGTKINSNSQPSYGSALGAGDVFQVAMDLDNNKLYFGKNGTWMSSSNPETGANPVYTLSAGTYRAIARPYGGATIAANFGQRAFAYTAPTNFKSLNTANLPTPTIADGSKYFDTNIWDGNSTSRDIATTLSPDFVWIKGRSHATNNVVYDAVRGATQVMYIDTGSATRSQSTQLTAFNSNSFSLAAGNEVNLSGRSYVGYAWDAGSSTTTIAAGSISSGVPSIASTVRANPTAGFSIVKYTPSQGSVIAHGLNQAPGVIFIKGLGSRSWRVYHKSIDPTKTLYFDTSHPAVDSSRVTAVTNTTFTYGTVGSMDYLAYCFAPVESYSAMGIYTGNGSSSDGPFVFTGFKVAWLLIRTTNSSEWRLYDMERNSYNPADRLIFPNSSEVEYASAGYNCDFVSNGFKMRNNHGGMNTSGHTYVYLAFASHPFKTARAH